MGNAENKENEDSTFFDEKQEFNLLEEEHESHYQMLLDKAEGDYWLEKERL